MKRISVTLLLSGIFFGATAQNFKKEFNDLFAKKDTAGQTEVLKKWEAADGRDPELYVAYFNYYVSKSKKEVIELGNNPKGESFQIMDKDTSVKEPVGYLYSSTYYDTVLLKKGFEFADIGIAKSPSRLDIRFGKIYMLGEIKNYRDFTAEIIKTIEYSDFLRNRWSWTDNKPVDDPKKFMLSSIQSYQLQLYNTNNDDLLENMKQIAETILKYYPDHVESLSNLSIVYMLRKDYNKALDMLLKAEKLAPVDYIVLSNIAQAYKLKGDKENAITYYEKTIKYGDDKAKKFARSQVKELKKSK
jgi:tetratricopeptide (TPR) repeat protein